MSITVCVVAHIERAAQALSLAGNTNARLFMDDGSLGEWANHERALRWAAIQGTSHAIILQDDALPIEEFLTHAEDAITIHPESLISFYTGTAQPLASAVLLATRGATRAGASWLSSPHLLWGVGIALPTTDIPELLDWASTDSAPYDARLGHWYHTQQRPVLYTWPSLVDHADGPTLVHHADGQPRSAPRHAHRIGAPDWNRMTVEIG